MPRALHFRRRRLLTTETAADTGKDEQKVHAQLEKHPLAVSISGKDADYVELLESAAKLNSLSRSGVTLSARTMVKKAVEKLKKKDIV